MAWVMATIQSNKHFTLNVIVIIVVAVYLTNLKHALLFVYIHNYGV